MPKAFFCIPSARPVAEVAPVVAKWKAMGYCVALQRDEREADVEQIAIGYTGAHLTHFRPYLGYAEAVNFLAAEVLGDNPEVDWIVCGGDDTYPDPNKTGDEIAAELCGYFVNSEYWAETSNLTGRQAETFGVMQPTGDRWNDGLGVIIDRIAGSPWLGREWCRRANGGRGPLWPEFSHMFVDEHLQLYAQSLGVFLQRPDLTHYHAHAQRDGMSPAPPHMAKWNTQKHWVESKAIFERLKAGNFEECKPIA